MGNEVIKFSNIGDYVTDPNSEADGIKLSFGKGRKITVLRSGATNNKYKVAMRDVFKPYMTTGGLTGLSDDESGGLMKRVYAQSIVIGWEGFTDDDGEPMVYSEDACVALFDAAPEIYDIVRTESAQFSNFVSEEIKEAGK